MQHKNPETAIGSHISKILKKNGLDNISYSSSSNLSGALKLMTCTGKIRPIMHIKVFSDRYSEEHSFVPYYSDGFYRQTMNLVSDLFSDTNQKVNEQLQDFKKINDLFNFNFLKKIYFFKRPELTIYNGEYAYSIGYIDLGFDKFKIVEVGFFGYKSSTDQLTKERKLHFPGLGENIYKIEDGKEKNTNAFIEQVNIKIRKIYFENNGISYNDDTTLSNEDIKGFLEVYDIIKY